MLGFDNVSIGIGIAVGLAVTAPWTVGRRKISGGAHKLRAFFRLSAGVSRFIAVKAGDIEWRRNQLHQEKATYFMKPLGRDETTGEVITLVRYPAGQINPEHVHDVGHGMYVLQGELVTHRGSFSAETFVWFPAHEVMWHGAGPNEDVVVLFSSAPDMQTRYVEKLNAPA